MADLSESDAQYTAAESVADGEKYTYNSDAQEYNVVPGTSNRMEHSEACDSVEYALSECKGQQQLYENGVSAYQPQDAGGHDRGYPEQNWSNPGYMTIGQEGLHYNGDVSHESHMVCLLFRCLCFVLALPLLQITYLWDGDTAFTWVG